MPALHEGIFGAGTDVSVSCFFATVEPLEDRRFFSTVTVPLVPTGLSPQQVRQAYSFNNIQFTTPRGKTLAGDGAGQTIAIVAAYRDPTIARDLRQFDQQFAIPNRAAKGGFALSIVMPQGQPRKTADLQQKTADWAQETALDVEWAHAMAPGARILLVECKSDSPQDLFAGVNFARKRRGVTVVSMSFGWDMLPAGIDYQDILTTPARHVGGLGRGDGVTFVEAGSDDGVANAFPDPSVNVVSVGGTTLTIDATGNYLSEIALAQSAAPATVAYDADPNTGFAVYDSTPDAGVEGWQVAGGTSAGAPQWAAIFAIADQGRALQGKHSLDTATGTLPALATLPPSDFHIITNGGVNMGRGSPFADRVIADLVNI
jgi:subtilase family serine protease